MTKKSTIHLSCLSQVHKSATHITSRVTRSWVTPIRCWCCKILRPWLLTYCAEPYKPSRVEDWLSFCWRPCPAWNSCTRWLWIRTRDIELKRLVKSSPDLMKGFYCRWVKILTVLLWMISLISCPSLNILTLSSLSIPVQSLIGRLLLSWRDLRKAYLPKKSLASY